MGKAAVPVRPWSWSIDANAFAPAHFSIDGGVRLPFAVGVPIIARRFGECDVGSAPCDASDARGVGNLPKVASDEPCPGPFVIGADVTSTNHERPAGVAESLQCSEDGVSAASSEI